MNIEQKRKEIILCIIEQNFLDWEAFQKEMNKIEQENSLFVIKEMRMYFLANSFMDIIDKIIEDLEENK